ncbi:hypothetical protein [Parendozoicomonas sp. Alg238-R29]|uniref:hypothetical protein n=1 Tax=Parendozoicomonas sp. Alg238-R29 TaxID=2993446 RepID=UPI00248D94C4|nr:hypothetical protein [Parendozoicomonas sp. Alg238-R29]
MARLAGERKPSGIVEKFAMSGFTHRIRHPGEYWDTPLPFVPSLQDLGYWKSA